MHAFPILLLVISSFQMTPPPQPQPNISSLHPLDTSPPSPIPASMQNVTTTDGSETDVVTTTGAVQS